MAPTLRPIQPGDGPLLHAVLGHPDVARWLRPADQAGPLTLAECEAGALRSAGQWAARVIDKVGLQYERDFEYAGYLHLLYRTPLGDVTRRASAPAAPATPPWRAAR